MRWNSELGEENYGGEVDFNPPEGIFRLASSVRGTFGYLPLCLSRSLSARVSRTDIPQHCTVTFISIQFSRIKIITISSQRDPAWSLYRYLDQFDDDPRLLLQELSRELRRKYIPFTYSY